MCLSRSGVRSMSGFRRALRTNGAIALTRCTSSSSTDGTSAQQQPPRVAFAQVNLLQILIEPALPETGPSARPLRRAAAAPATVPRGRVSPLRAHSAPAWPTQRLRLRVTSARALRQQVIAAQPFVRTQQPADVRAASWRAPPFPLPSCARRNRAAAAPSGTRC